MLFLMSIALLGQEAEGFRSTEVHPDGSITFRYKDLNASKVLLHLDGYQDPFTMEKGSDGLWSFLSPALSPEIYDYSFEADGQLRVDPKNSSVTPNLLYSSTMVTVPGATPQLWEARDVPHGVVQHHFYTSKVVQGLVDGQSEYYVYTPPAYEPRKGKPLPVLYLLHGWSDMANGWLAVGKANFIFDNLIAEHKMKPMVVVMPLGYGDMKFVNSGHGVWDDSSAIAHNVDLFSQALLGEVLPQVESEYHVSRKRDDRAIAGLSMGGRESLALGLNHPDQFAWVGAFSAALGHDDEQQFAAATRNNSARHLLWIACGTGDALITPNRKFIDWLKTKDVAATAVETPGLHTWLVWRDNLIHFTPLLFQKH